MIPGIVGTGSRELQDHKIQEIEGTGTIEPQECRILGIDATGNIEPQKYRILGIGATDNIELWEYWLLETSDFRKIWPMKPGIKNHRTWEQMAPGTPWHHVS